MDVHRGKQLRGYLAMLVVDKTYRGKGIGEPWRGCVGLKWVWLLHVLHSPTYPETPNHRNQPTTTTGSKLARMAIQAMIDGGAEEVALEAEVTNTGALMLYRALGFIRDKRLHRWAAAGRLCVYVDAAREVCF